MTDALLSYTREQGRRDANLDALKIKEWLSAAANPIAARPKGLAVATASIGEAEPPYIVRHSQWQNWLNLKPHFPSPLWVSGAPGCGKSTLAHKVVEHLTKTQHSSVIVSHAFQSTVSTQHRPLMCLAASILDQLLPRDWETQTQKHVFERLVPSYNQYRLHSNDCPFEDLWDHCASLLKSETRFILVIDALDECIFDRAGQEADFLDRILDLLSTTPGGRIVIFSRPCPVLGVGVTLDLEENEIRISTEDTLPEINAFCDSASAKLPLPKELQLKVANRARADAQGSFLWATLFLQEFTNVLDKAHVMEILDKFPDNCWERYAKTWRDGIRELEPQVQESCRSMLLILLGARSKFSLEDIEDSLDLLPNSAQRISKYCQPLVLVVDGVLQLSHASVRDFLLNDDKKTQTTYISISKSEPDEALARTCLEYLLRKDYAQTDRIGQRLRRNVGLGGSTERLEQNFYNYAARNWYIHLAALSSPGPSLLRLAEEFLHAIQFTYWAEYSYTDAGDFQAIRSTEIALHIWMKNLSDDDRALLHLNDYFERPYKDLSRAYKENSDDKVLQWLALMHLGFYYFDKGKMTEMTQVRQEVAAGLSELLGRCNPLALRARSDAAYTFLFNGDLREAQRLYAEVYDDQRKVLDNDDPSLFFTLIYQGQVEYLMTHSSKALEILTSAAAGFLRTSGPESNGFLITQLWSAVADASVGHTSQAIKMMEYVREKREERYGPDDSFGMATKIFVGDLYRKLEKKEEALANIEPGFEFRRGFWPKSHFLTIDTSLVLATTYRDFGMNHLAEKTVDDLESHGNLEREENYIRLCQARHLRGLLLFDGGHVDQAITVLDALLIQYGHEDSNNRALQWVRLDLAGMLRYRGREGDERLASSLFDGIVTDGGGREPDPPLWLRISEAALRLVRDGKLDAAGELLREEKLRWTREEDLWMRLGMPAADTGWMKPPRGLGVHAPSSGWVVVLPGE
ncbi:hypothetical protein CDV36_015591 [Fusarium kuroshium]|uniref:Nephrocystin 3-like N-terminal domain-containing protein n=1 Tax=Fusarium kuroshium TaxID=2010991 RepID=A0A3M2R9U8_9HYPO|nr:hypothetical protein CDV36_015591 [Fusarium kuroshium]